MTHDPDDLATMPDDDLFKLHAAAALRRKEAYRQGNVGAYEDASREADVILAELDRRVEEIRRMAATANVPSDI